MHERFSTVQAQARLDTKPKIFLLCSTGSTDMMWRDIHALSKITFPLSDIWPLSFDSWSQNSGTSTEEALERSWSLTSGTLSTRLFPLSKLQLLYLPMCTFRFSEQLWGWKRVSRTVYLCQLGGGPQHRALWNLEFRVSRKIVMSYCYTEVIWHSRENLRSQPHLWVILGRTRVFPGTQCPQLQKERMGRESSKILNLWFLSAKEELHWLETASSRWKANEQCWGPTVTVFSSEKGYFSHSVQ